MSDENVVVDETTEEEQPEETTDNVAIKDADNPLDAQSSENIAQLLKNIEGVVQIMQSQWEASARELGLKDKHMKMLAVVNDRHKIKPPENATEEELANWDYMNGIDHITEEEVDEIFEEGHPVRGVDHSQTVDRIKGACQDFYGWLTVMREYRQVHDAYLKLVELEEEKQIEELKSIMEKEEDQEKKQSMQNSIDMYYNRKYLSFLAGPLDDMTKKRIVKTLENGEKAQYMINRCRDRLSQMNISSKFILELSKFENRFLDEKYHENSNVLLIYFMSICIHSDPNNKKDDGRVKTVCMVMALDSFIRNTMAEETRKSVLNNIIALEEQMLGLCPKPEGK